MQDPKDWKFPTHARGRHPSAERTRRAVREEQVLSDLDEWRSTTRGRSRKPERQERRRGLLRSLLALLLLFVVAGAALTWLANRAYQDRIHPAVVVGDVPVGSLTAQQAADKLQGRLEPFLDEPVTLRLGQRTWQPSTEELGLSVDIDASVQRAFSAPTADPPIVAAGRALLARQTPVTVPLVIMLDQEQLDIYLNDVAEQVNQDPINPRVLVSGEDVSVEAGGQGFTFLREETVAELRRSVTALDNQPVQVQVFASEGRVSGESIERAEEQARQVVSGPVLLEAEGRRWEIPARQLGEWLRSQARDGENGQTELAVALDRVEVETYLQRIAQQVSQPPLSARLQWVDGRVEVLRPSEPGRRLELAAAADAIERAALSEARLVQLPVSPAPPRVTEASSQTLGIDKLLGTGEAFFQGAPDEHAENTRRAADAVTGYVVLPGEEFSFSEAVGEVSEESGYRSELIGDGERGLQGPWTGVTQVGTAIFRAALRTGLPVQERNAAPYRVPYYEQGGQITGTEAVISLPEQDLRFQNDTQTALLVQVLVGDGRLRVELYGGSVQRQVEIASPEVTNVVQPVGDVYWDDPATNSEETRLYAPAQAGQEVVVRRRIRTPDAPVEEETFFTSYEPLPSVFIGKQP